MDTLIYSFPIYSLVLYLANSLHVEIFSFTIVKFRCLKKTMQTKPLFKPKWEAVYKKMFELEDFSDSILGSKTMVRWYTWQTNVTYLIEVFSKKISNKCDIFLSHL